MKPISRIFLFLLFISASYAISYAQENQSYFLHTIEKGQSLYSIAKMCNVTTNDIIRLNPGCDEKIYAGQAIKIPKGKESQKGETFHTIQAGETLYKLTTIYNISVRLFSFRWNKSRKRKLRKHRLKNPLYRGLYNLDAKICIR